MGATGSVVQQHGAGCIKAEETYSLMKLYNRERRQDQVVHVLYIIGYWYMRRSMMHGR